MDKRLLLRENNGKQVAKDVLVLEAKQLAHALTGASWNIVQELQVKESYPKELAKKLGINEQTVYYYINKLEKAGLISVVRTEEKQGALCKYYAPTASVFAAELEGGEHPLPHQSSPALPEVHSFFREFDTKGTFNGSIVVGSPAPHGPFLTAARDGHYAVQLSMFLGSLFSLENRFVIKLDTEAKAENAVDRNLVIFGGPVTNTLCSDANNHLQIKFAYENAWSIYSPKTNTNYSGELDGLIAKIKNPWDATKKLVVVAGLKQEGTKACVVALTQQYRKVLEKYEKHKDFYAVVRGLDRDGDGKVDDIELLESVSV